MNKFKTFLTEANVSEISTLVKTIKKELNNVTKYTNVVKCKECSKGANWFLVITPKPGKQDNILNWLNREHLTWNPNDNFWFVTEDNLEVEVEDASSGDVVIGMY